MTVDFATLIHIFDVHRVQRRSAMNINLDCDIVINAAKSGTAGSYKLGPPTSSSIPNTACL